MFYDSHNIWNIEMLMYVYVAFYDNCCRYTYVELIERNRLFLYDVPRRWLIVNRPLFDFSTSIYRIHSQESRDRPSRLLYWIGTKA